MHEEACWFDSAYTGKQELWLDHVRWAAVVLEAEESCWIGASSGWWSYEGRKSATAASSFMWVMMMRMRMDMGDDSRRRYPKELDGCGCWSWPRSGKWRHMCCSWTLEMNHDPDCRFGVSQVHNWSDRLTCSCSIYNCMSKAKFPGQSVCSSGHHTGRQDIRWPPYVITWIQWFVIINLSGFRISHFLLSVNSPTLTRPPAEPRPPPPPAASLLLLSQLKNYYSTHFPLDCFQVCTDYHPVLDHRLILGFSIQRWMASWKGFLADALMRLCYRSY